MPFAMTPPEFVTSRRHLVAAGVGLAVVLALTTAATFARGPAGATPVAAAATSTATVLGIAPDGPRADLPTAVATSPAGATVTVAAPTAAPTPDGPAITALAAQGIPIVALQAYQKAAAIEATEEPSCRLGWTLVAAIGAIESGHGSHAGARLYADGQDLPHVIGPVLDGSAGNARIADTDKGLLDGDPVYDRAVGPMQFIPSTWARHGRDANGDGRADPFNIVDAAATTADYLCAGGGDLSTDAGRRAAVFSYNHLDSYVATVLALDAAYADRPVTTTSPSPAAPPKPVAPPSPVAPTPTPSRTTAAPTSTPTTSTPTTSTPTTPTPTPTPTCPTASPSGSPGASPTGSPTATPTDCPTPTGSASGATSGPPSAASSLASSSVAAPSVTPGALPSATPSG